MVCHVSPAHYCGIIPASARRLRVLPAPPGARADQRDGDVSAAGIACHRTPLGPQGAFVEALRGSGAGLKRDGGLKQPGLGRLMSFVTPP